MGFSSGNLNTPLLSQINNRNDRMIKTIKKFRSHMDSIFLILTIVSIFDFVLKKMHVIHVLVGISNRA
jgi:hypothetical protein